MKNISHKLGKDDESSYIQVYFMDKEMEIASHQFSDYDSAHEVLSMSYKMFEKLLNIYTFYKSVREVQKEQ